MAVLFIVLAAILLSCAESRTGSQCKIESKEFEVLVLVVLRNKGSFFFCIGPEKKVLERLRKGE